MQLPGPDSQQIAFKGKVADVDQSKVWPAGTCLGIDPASSQQTDVPVDCASPHAMEITGVVNLAEKFPDALPSEPDQDVFIKDACTRMTDAYLAPIQLRNTTLTLTYNTVSLPTWSAGSHQVSCFIGATLGNGGWAALLNSAKGPLLINGQPPVPPPDIPADRLNLPPVPMPDSAAAQSPSSSSSGSGSSSSGSSGSGSSGSGSSGSGSSSGRRVRRVRRARVIRVSRPSTSRSSPPPRPRRRTQPAPPPTQGNIFNPPPPDAPPQDAPFKTRRRRPPTHLRRDRRLGPPVGPPPGPVELLPPA